MTNEVERLRASLFDLGIAPELDVFLPPKKDAPPESGETNTLLDGGEKG